LLTRHNPRSLPGFQHTHNQATITIAGSPVAQNVIVIVAGIGSRAELNAGDLSG